MIIFVAEDLKRESQVILIFHSNMHPTVEWIQKFGSLSPLLPSALTMTDVLRIYGF